MAGAYIPLSSEDVVLSTDSVTSAMWSDNSPTLLNYFTSSAQVASAVAPYYYTVYQTASTETTPIKAEIQFDIAYCDAEGSGSIDLNPLVTGTSPTRINYGQYRNLVLGDENASFIFGNYSSSYFYVLNLERARYKQNILPGTWTLELSASATNTDVKLTDDSLVNPVTSFTDAGRVYNIISGSAGVVTNGGIADSAHDASGWTLTKGSYGWMLPDVNLLILNGAALDGVVGDGGIDLTTLRGQALSTNTDNNPLLVFNALNLGGGNWGQGGTAAGNGLGTGFTLNSQENLSSDFIFCRARNNQINYSSNPSFISSSTGAILFDSFITNPTTYITTVGLYNDSQELLATAKLSRPLEKDFTKELLVRVKLDF